MADSSAEAHLEPLAGADSGELELLKPAARMRWPSCFRGIAIVSAGWCGSGWTRVSPDVSIRRTSCRRLSGGRPADSGLPGPADRSPVRLAETDHMADLLSTRIADTLWRRRENVNAEVNRMPTARPD